MAKRLIPSFNRVLIEKIVPPSKTSAGILLPEKTSQVLTHSIFSFVCFWFCLNLCDSNYWTKLCVVLKQLNSGKVIAVGPGSRDKAGNLIPVAVKEGDRVLLPEYGGTQIKLDDKEYDFKSYFVSFFWMFVCVRKVLGLKFYEFGFIFGCRFHLFRDEDILGILHDWCRDVFAWNIHILIGLENNVFRLKM